MKYNFFVIILILICSCANNSIKKKRIGDSIVEANFIDTIIEGQAKFYNLKNGNLESQIEFIKGIKNGMEITYYPNGRIKDSAYYINGLVTGNRFSYDSNGLLLFMSTSYYGMDVGDRLYYRNNRPTEYYFSNFEHKRLIDCTYDSLGSCNYLRFNAKPIITTVSNQNGDSAISLFLYLPHPPDFNIIYTLGLINGHIKKDEKQLIISNRKLVLDTILKIPPKDWDYFLSIDYKNLSRDTTVTQFFGKFGK